MRGYPAIIPILASLLQGCIGVAVGGGAIVSQVMQGDFDSRRAMVKEEWGLGRLPHDQSRNGCLALMTQPDPKHAAPPPYDERVCDFGSPWDLRYELVKSIEQGLIGPSEWLARCEGIPNRPNDTFCQYDPIAEKVTAWKAHIAAMRASTDGVLMDCERLFLNRRLPNGPTTSVCKF